eukprot:6491874-Amphidinium_carterae.2
MCTAEQTCWSSDRLVLRFPHNARNALHLAGSNFHTDITSFRPIAQTATAHGCKKFENINGCQAELRAAGYATHIEPICLSAFHHVTRRRSAPQLFATLWE